MPHLTTTRGLAVLVACLIVLGIMVPTAQAQDLGACRQTTDLQRALQACTNIIERRGNNPSSKETLSYAHHRRAYARTRSGDLPGAIADYTSAIGINDKDTAAWLGRAQAHLDNRAWGAAAGDFRKAIELRDNFAPAHVGLARALAGEGDTQRALASYEAAIRLAPGNRDAIIGRSEALVRLGRAGDAVDQLAEAARQQPGDTVLRDALEAVRRTQVAATPPVQQPATPPRGQTSAPPATPADGGTTQLAARTDTADRDRDRVRGLPPLVAPIPGLEQVLPQNAPPRETAAPTVRIAEPPVARERTVDRPAERIAASQAADQATAPAPFYCGMIRSWSPHAAKYTGVRLENLGCP